VKCSRCGQSIHVEQAPQIDGDAQGCAAPARDARAESRARLMAAVGEWIDRMLDGEPPPEGLPRQLLAEAQAALDQPPPEEPGDLYTLASALTGLSGEVGLQGRAFKHVSETLAPLGELPRHIAGLEAAQSTIAEELQRLRQQIDPAQAASARHTLDVLFDLYERLRRGLATSQSVKAAAGRRRGWLASLLRRERNNGHDPVDALREGYALTLARLEAAFHQWGITRIGEVGQIFDPQRMTAIEVQETDQAPEGTVLEVYRGGYMIQGQVLATAQVKVARRKAPPA